MEEVIIALRNPIDVAIDGAAIACDEVALRPPTGRVQSQVQRIHQLIADSISTNMARNTKAPSQDKDKTDADSVMDGDTIISLLSLGGNLGGGSKLLSEIFDAGFATIGGQPLKRALRENMLVSDLEALEAAYLGNFTVPSWMKKAG